MLCFITKEIEGEGKRKRERERERVQKLLRRKRQMKQRNTRTHKENTKIMHKCAAWINQLTWVSQYLMIYSKFKIYLVLLLCVQNYQNIRSSEIHDSCFRQTDKR